MSSKDNSDIRNRIDDLDRGILEMLNQRAALSVRIGRRKADGGRPVHDAVREREVKETLKTYNTGPLPGSAIDRIFGEIISASRSLQGPIQVSFLGPEGTFSHQAALGHFGRAAGFLARNTIGEVFREVESGRADFGMVPVENSLEGAVGLTLDRLVDTTALVCGEFFQPVAHALMSLATDAGSVKRVYSHPQALAQCRGWLAANLPGAALLEADSTAAAAVRAADEPDSAAVGSEMLAEIHGLEVLARDIQDRARNMTRFLVLGGLESRPSGRDKTSLMVAAPHQPGALHTCLAALAEHGVNMTRIESRPSRDLDWNYLFFIDIEGHVRDEAVKAALDQVARTADRLKILGSYPQA